MSEGGKKFRSRFSPREIEEIRNVPTQMQHQFNRQIEDRGDDQPFGDLELGKFYMSLVKSKIDTSQINTFTDKINQKWKAPLPRNHLKSALNFAEYEWSAMAVANDKAKGETNIKGSFGFTDLADYAYGRIRKINDTFEPVVYRHGKELVRIVKDNKTQKDEIEILYSRSLRPIVNRHAPFYEGQSGEAQSISAPMDVVEELFYGDYQFPELNQIATYPVFAPDGALIDDNGYDEETGIFMSLPSDLHIPSVPRKPIQLDIDNALGVFCDLFGDFPFDGQNCRPDGEPLEADEIPASMANMLAMLLTPYCRQMINGPLPLAFISKPKVATGASLLAASSYIIAAGVSEPSAALPSSEEERRKTIFASLRKQKPYGLFDNVSGEITSDALASVLTATTFEGRVLGKSEMATVSANAMFVMTSNNARLNEDLKRRAFLIRLDARMENPKNRTGFKYDLEGTYVSDHRGEFLWAALTLIKGWVEAGSPPPKNAPHMASYGEWVRVIGGILEYAGVETFLGNEDQKDAVAAINEAQGINDLIAIWWENAQDPKQSAVQEEMLVGSDDGLVALCHANDIELEGVRKTRKDMDLVYDATALGKFLSDHADAYFNIDGVEVRLEKGNARQRRVVWKLTRKDETA